MLAAATAGQGTATVGLAAATAGNGTATARQGAATAGQACGMRQGKTSEACFLLKLLLGQIYIPM